MANQRPYGYDEQTIGSAHILARSDIMPQVVSAVRASGTLYEHALAHSSVRLSGGRAPVVVLEMEGIGSCAVRHYWRGGAVAKLLGDRYLRFGTPRPHRELEVSWILDSCGVRTPPVLASVVYDDGIWYRGDVITLLVSGATDLAELSIGPEPWSEVERERAWFAAGDLLRAFFATGAEHIDLNLRNIIVQRETGRAYLLDLDRCVLPEKRAASRADAMIARLHRSRRKLEAQTGRTVSARELAALKRGRGT